MFSIKGNKNNSLAAPAVNTAVAIDPVEPTTPVTASPLVEALLNNYKQESNPEASVDATNKKVILEISPSNEIKKSDTLVDEAFTAAASEKTEDKQKVVLDDALAAAAVVSSEKKPVEKKGIFRRVCYFYCI